MKAETSAPSSPLPTSFSLTPAHSLLDEKINYQKDKCPGRKNKEFKEPITKEVWFINILLCNLTSNLRTASENTLTLSFKLIKVDTVSSVWRERWTRSWD